MVSRTGCADGKWLRGCHAETHERDPVVAWKLVRSSAFVQAARRLLQKRPKTAEDLRAPLELLGLDAFHPRLKTHKLKGDPQNLKALGRL